MRPNALTWIGLALLVVELVGLVLSITYCMASWFDQDLGNPWPLTVLAALAIVLNWRAGRWGLAGTLLAVLLGPTLIAGQLAAPVSVWALKHHPGFLLYVGVLVLTAGAMTVAALRDTPRHYRSALGNPPQPRV